VATDGHSSFQALEKSLEITILHLTITIDEIPK
jgi:hypothetical protein